MHVTAVVINVITLYLQGVNHPSWITDSFPRRVHFILGLPKDRLHRTAKQNLDDNSRGRSAHAGDGKVAAWDRSAWCLLVEVAASY